MSSAVDNESADEYGRCSGCFRNHQLPPFSLRSHAASMRASTITAETEGRHQEPGLHVWHIPQPKIKLDSPVAEQAEPLQHFCDSPEPTSRPPSLLPRWCTIESLLLPVGELDLGSLPEIDAAEYIDSISSMRTCVLREAWLPLDPVPAELDESLAFPHASEELRLALRRQLADETIEAITDETTLKDMDKRLPLSSEPDSARASGFFLCEALRGRPRCITPPLSSVSSSEPSSPFVPGPDVCIIDLASTASSPAPSPVQQLQSRLRDGHLDSDITVPATVIITSPPPICPDHELNYDSAADLAVDIPLSSVVSDPLSANEALNAIQLPVLEDSSDLISHEELRGEDFDDALLAILNSRHSQLSTALDQEQLCPYDTISRLPLPLVDIGIPKAQWALNWTARQHLSELRSFMPMRLLVPCIPQDSLLDSELKWVPLPRGTGKLAIDEELTTSVTSRQYEALEDPPKTLQSIDNIRTSSPTIMKPAEDPELDWSGDSPFASDDDSVESLTTGTDIQRLSSVVPRSAFPLPTGFQAVRQGQGLDAKSSPNHLDVSSTTRLLDDFMALRAIKRPRLSGAGTLSSDPTLRAAQSLLPATHHRQESIPPTPQELRRAPKPAFEIPDRKGPCIVSLALDRSIIRHLESCWPPELLIDRDFWSHGAEKTSAEAGVQGEPACLTTVEADVCLTATMGLVATSLVKVRQKPLPGSKGRASLRDRIYHVSQKYERLVVLVSESNVAGEVSGSLSPSDLASYADFARFVTGLDTPVSTCLVPGASGTLAQWILAFMSRCSTGTAGLVDVITSEESSWELFFRRSGLNAMSAQIMSKSLHAEHGDAGLAEFLHMPTHTKIAKYSTVLGGHKALARCSTLLDRTWL